MKKIYQKLLLTSGWMGLLFLVIGFIAGLIVASEKSGALAIVIAMLVFMGLIVLSFIALHGSWHKEEKDEKV